MDFFFSSSIDTTADAANREQALRLDRTLERAMHELLPISLVAGLIAAMAILWVLQGVVPVRLLAAWFTARLLVSALRGTHSTMFLTGKPSSGRSSLTTYRVLAALDGLAWGALGWALTPLLQLEVAVVTIPVLIGVAALGNFMLHMDFPSAGLFITPILLPNSVYSLSRQDNLGLFCALMVFALMVILILEAKRANQRITELLRLRFQSEQVTLAQAEALQQAQALSETRSRFLATMSHEMRTPLHGILGLVRLLRKQECDPQAAHQLDLIRGSGDHLVHVINDILDFSRMETGKLPLHEEAFDLPALLQEVAEASSVSATEKGLRWQVQIDLGRDEDVQGDPVRIRQVLHNLLGNAIKFTPQGFVRLHAWRDPATQLVTVAVHDSGVGIPAAEQSAVFKAFHQADGTYQRRFGGTGLGLTISRELCQAMGGDLSCRSEVGQGSVFTFTLPLAVVPSCQPVPKGGAQAHILLVEDNPVNTLVAEAELRQLGIQVTTFSNGREVVDWLQTQRADLVLMDCEMPEMDGFEATQQIRDQERRNGHAPIGIVALTANGGAAHSDRCLRAGMNDCLSKPFRPNDLARVLSRYLHSNQGRQPTHDSVTA